MKDAWVTSTLQLTIVGAGFFTYLLFPYHLLFAYLHSLTMLKSTPLVMVCLRCSARPL